MDCYMKMNNINDYLILIPTMVNRIYSINLRKKLEYKFKISNYISK